MKIKEALFPIQATKSFLMEKKFEMLVNIINYFRQKS